MIELSSICHYISFMLLEKEFLLRVPIFHVHEQKRNIIVGIGWRYSALIYAHWIKVSVETSDDHTLVGEQMHVIELRAMCIHTIDLWLLENQNTKIKIIRKNQIKHNFLSTKMDMNEKICGWEHTHAYTKHLKKKEVYLIKNLFFLLINQISIFWNEIIMYISHSIA